MDVERREEGFDLSGSSNLKGQFCSGRGLGVWHYNQLIYVASAVVENFLNM